MHRSSHRAAAIRCTGDAVGRPVDLDRACLDIQHRGEPIHVVIETMITEEFRLKQVSNN